MNVVWHRKAEVDLSDIADYIAENNPRAALRVFDKIAATAGQLTAFPNLGREGRVTGTRELVVSGLPYIVVYRLSQEEIHIVGIQHTSPLWPENFPTEEDI
jgi:addiction module RelE/StbE family toxin